ncbi:MAG TPA: tyrosine-type recombinase/integrase [Candidatus Acidoferrales bacterium]
MLSIYRRHSPNCPQKSRRYKRCSCACWTEGTIDGKYLRRSLRTRSWERAQKTVQNLENGDQVVRVTLKHACDSFIGDAKSRGLREPSIYKYTFLFGKLNDFAENEDLKYLNEFDVETLRRFRETLPNKNFAARNKTENLRALFRFCHQAGWIKTNPGAMLKSPKVTSLPTEPFTKDQMTNILTACDGYEGSNRLTLKAFVLLLRHSGLRIRDAVTLRRDAISDGKLFLYSAKTGVPVRLPLPPEVLAALEALPKVGDCYFWSKVGLPKTRVANFQGMLTTVFTTAKVSGGHAHRFRDTFAVELLLKAIPIERVAALLGNTPAVAARHYSPWIAARQEQIEEDIRSTWKIDTDKNTYSSS